MWLHYPADAVAVARGDQYMWGADMLVAPVVEKGATSRAVYLPRGTWHDFWTEERVDGGRELNRPVDLSITPLYVRAGAVIPMGPVKQYTSEPSTEPLALVVYPGADGESHWYEDDGTSFNYRKGESMSVVMSWRDASRRLTLRLAPQTKMFGPSRRIAVRVAGSTTTQDALFTGHELTIAVR
jgi:alpha-glucosidase (family GH31 glycosyl hydrolase)